MYIKCTLISHKERVTFINNKLPRGRTVCYVQLVTPDLYNTSTVPQRAKSDIICSDVSHQPRVFKHRRLVHSRFVAKFLYENMCVKFHKSQDRPKHLFSFY